LTPAIVVALPGRERTYGPDELPLEVGGPGAELPVPGSQAPLAWIGADGDEIFVQPAEGAPDLLCNGAAVATSRWLRHGDTLRVGGTRIEVERSGDRLRLVVQHAGSDVPTEPPRVIAAPARVADAPPEQPIAPAAFTPRPIGVARRARGLALPGRRAAGLGLLLSLLLAAAWFLLSAHPVELRVEPAPERLELAGPWPRLALGGRRLLRPGEYRVRAELEGYRPLEQGFRVEDRAGQRFRFRLARLPGRLRIDAGDAGGVRVLVDGEERGETPLQPLELEPGRHAVRLESPRYRPFETIVEVEGAGVEQTLEARLEPMWAEVTIASAPPGAEVRHEGRVLGVTPLSVELIAGSRRVELALAGHKPVARTLVVVAGEPQALPVVRLAPSDGNLLLSSEPAGAAITVDGRWRGETPLDVYLAPGRPHSIRVSRVGYAPETLELELGAGETRQVSVTLGALLGELEVAALPADAELYVGGVHRGRASQRLELPATEHEVEIRREGFETWSGRVTIRPDFRQTLRVELERPASREPASLAPLIQSPEGHELRLVRGGRFQMGASRREPGRRANEVLREVELVRPFYVATREVSNRQFRRFRSDHLSGRFGSLSLETDHHPVVRVSWQQAAAYCNWLSERESLPPAYVARSGVLVAAQPMTTGYRLPSEAEWARVARFATGPAPLKYPWGAELPIPVAAGNFADASGQGVVPGALSDYDDGHPGTAPVGSFAPNGLGLHDLGGNAAEWVHDHYSLQPPAGGVERDPMGPASGEFRVIRGSSFLHSTVSELRLSYRDYGAEPRADVGFRIARYAE
jgi:formylglycine-generating enzyme required for sulfatase activity